MAMALSRPSRFTGRRAFTLIELLIVVAIISTLAAIATPNFLEAQTRTKVSRTKADLQSLGTALETYRVDFNAYPVVGNPNLPSSSDLYTPYEKRLTPLTTPVAYTTSLPVDPFYKKPEPNKTKGSTYVYAPVNLYAGAGSQFSASKYRNTIYSISGRGPDGNIYFGGYCMAHPKAYEYDSNIIGQYDPTNGTISDGDIIRLGSDTLGRQP